MPKGPILVDYKRAKGVVFPRLLDARLLGLPPYDKPVVQGPHNLPRGLEKGSKEHALFLWNVCYYMKGGIASETAIKKMTRIFAESPQLFRPENFVDLGDEKETEAIIMLLDCLRFHGLGSNVEEVARFWVWNFQKLARYYQGDPRLIFREANERAAETWLSYETASMNYDYLCRVLIRKSSWKPERVRRERVGFFNFRHKMVSMLAYFLIDAGMVKPFAYPVPVDFHILRVLRGTDIIRPHRSYKRRPYRERFTAMAREITLRYIIETGTRPEYLADALWYLSRDFCRLHPGNSSSVEKIRRGRKREIRVLPVIWSATNDNRYRRTCGQCQIRGECRWHVPSSYYYVKGTLETRGSHIEPDQFLLIDTPVLPGSYRRNGNGTNHEPKKPLVLADSHQVTLF